MSRYVAIRYALYAMLRDKEWRRARASVDARALCDDTQYTRAASVKRRERVAICAELIRRQDAVKIIAAAVASGVVERQCEVAR